MLKNKNIAGNKTQTEVNKHYSLEAIVYLSYFLLVWLNNTNDKFKCHFIKRTALLGTTNF